ncbi:uncharacterized protein [Cicer arietinum]|uniref:uncharacterized protein n=1 Tax=Cicer arietinum TaxID=3827 RepID=UPI003CC564E6
MEIDDHNPYVDLQNDKEVQPQPLRHHTSSIRAATFSQRPADKCWEFGLGNFPSNLPILDGKNWERWSASMRSLLVAQEVFEIIQEEYEQLGLNPIKRQQAAFKDFNKRDCKTLFYTQQSEDSNNFERISKMEEDENVADYFNRVQEIANQMQNNGKVINELMIIEKILRTLTPRYDHILVATEESKNLETLKVEDLQGSLESHELRLKERNECRSKKVQRDDGEAQMEVEDSGCSNHMIGHKEWLVSIDEKVKREIKFAENIIVTAEGVSKVLIQRKDSKQSFICDVLYVPNMKNNLMSLGKLLEK